VNRKFNLPQGNRQSFGLREGAANRVRIAPGAAEAFGHVLAGDRSAGNEFGGEQGFFI